MHRPSRSPRGAAVAASSIATITAGMIRLWGGNPGHETASISRASDGCEKRCSFIVTARSIASLRRARTSPKIARNPTRPSRSTRAAVRPRRTAVRGGATSTGVRIRWVTPRAWDGRGRRARRETKAGLPAPLQADDVPRPCRPWRRWCRRPPLHGNARARRRPGDVQVSPAFTTPRVAVYPPLSNCHDATEEGSRPCRESSEGRSSRPAGPATRNR